MAFGLVALLTVSVLLLAVFGSVVVATSRGRTASPLRRETLEDPLTGIGNRRALFRSGPTLLAEARRGGRPAALLLMDLDGLKVVNDLHGHAAGDRLLVAFAHMAHDYLPPTGLVCRIGGGEFAALLPGADGLRARSVADEIRALFAHVAIPGPRGPVRSTVSIGTVASTDLRTGTAGPDLRALLDRAGCCLSAAKDGGRDRVADEGGAGSDGTGHAGVEPVAVAPDRLSFI
jgi:diguanylate cyclase (GGDEF)-like protein